MNGYIRPAAIGLLAAHAVALVLIIVGSCHHALPSGASSTPEVGCAAACNHMRELCCPSVLPTPEGATCEDVCASVQRSGIVSWNLECRARAASCDDIDACEGP